MMSPSQAIFTLCVGLVAFTLGTLLGAFTRPAGEAYTLRDKLMPKPCAEVYVTRATLADVARCLPELGQ